MASLSSAFDEPISPSEQLVYDSLTLFVIALTFIFLVYYIMQTRRYLKTQRLATADPYTIATFVLLGISVTIDVIARGAIFILDLVIRYSYFPEGESPSDYHELRNAVKIILRTSSSLRNISLMVNVSRWALVIFMLTQQAKQEKLESIKHKEIIMRESGDSNKPHWKDEASKASIVSSQDEYQNSIEIAYGIFQRKIHIILGISVLLEVALATAFMAVDQIAGVKLGSFEIGSLNFYEYFLLTPLMTISYTIIYQKLTKHQDEQIQMQRGTITYEEILQLQRTRKDIRCFFICMVQYLLLRVLRMVIRFPVPEDTPWGLRCHQYINIFLRYPSHIILLLGVSLSVRKALKRDDKPKQLQQDKKHALATLPTLSDGGDRSIQAINTTRSNISPRVGRLDTNDESLQLLLRGQSK